MKIKAAENGPYLIEVTEAKIIKDGKEEVLTQKTIALCRCGQSSKNHFAMELIENVNSVVRLLKLK